MKRHVWYEDAVVSYTDILGFKALIEEASAGRISRILRIFKASASPYPDDYLKGRSRHEAYISFSDLCVHALPLRKRQKNIRGAATNLIQRLANAQLQLLIQEKVLLRGGVAIGGIVKSYGLLYGSGLLNAYALEQSQPHYPQIIVDQTVVAEVESNSRLWRFGKASEVNALKAMLRWDDECKAWFIDYLKYYNESADSWQYESFMRAHARFINDGLAKFRDDRKTYAKYEWLADYHKKSYQELPFDEDARRG